MPKIYSEEKRLEIKEQLMDVGLDLIKQYGIKKLSIEAITKKVGIAQGTFYNFFKSKEILVYYIADRYQEKINTKMNLLLESKGYWDRTDLHSLYRGMFLKDEDNVYRFLTREDLQILLSRLPKDLCAKISDTKAQIEHNLGHVRDKKKDCDLDAIINWIQILNLTITNKDLLVDKGIDKVAEKLIESLLNEIFDETLKE